VFGDPEIAKSLIGEPQEREIAEMRRQIAELKADAAQTDKEDKDAARSGLVLSNTFALLLL